MEFPGKGSNPEPICKLHHSCGNTGVLTHCAGPGIKPVSQCSRDAVDPIAPQWEFLNLRKFPSISSMLSQMLYREKNVEIMYDIYLCFLSFFSFFFFLPIWFSWLSGRQLTRDTTKLGHHNQFNLLD